ncbi:sugar ABC transporter permease [[Clostridium] cellulosi]|jgi:carbohydrate ABC transporter membrane protein 1, CUT1 family (TC 3.A.1.1.-)|uniref:Sugar ABC transporter permease n=1 Tax=[Clostridium] cellulosi TaxID=29343 RepID=A0A078KJI6_9FIRM|nr:sugar ABC transporter permease [[Clostridium] cellulosi]
MITKTLQPKRGVIAALLFPGLFIYGFIVILPLFTSLYYSLFNYSGGLASKFIGFQNYAQLIKDMDFWNAFKNNLIIIALCLIGQLGIAMIITVFMTSKLLRFNAFHRNVIFLPAVISAVVVGFLWTIIYNKDYGFLNVILKNIGLGSLIKPWLDDPKIVMISVSIPIIWQYIGFYMVIFLSAYQSISPDIFESAELDGATGIKRTFFITLPLMKDTMKVAVMLCIAGNMKIFDQIYVMTGGGPGNSSTVLAQYAYQNSFIMFRLGYGSAISIGILILSVSIILISRRLFGGDKDDT